MTLRTCYVLFSRDRSTKVEKPVRVYLDRAAAVAVVNILEWLRDPQSEFFLSEAMIDHQIPTEGTTE